MGDARGAPLIESGRSKLCGEDHQREEQDEGGPVDGCAEIADCHRFACEQQHEGDERYADSIELQPWNATERHAHIGQYEYERDERWHSAGRPLTAHAFYERF